MNSFAVPISPKYRNTTTSVIFETHDQPAFPYAIWQGWETFTRSSDFSWNDAPFIGAPTGDVKFTLSGDAIVHYGDRCYELGPGQLFLFERPGDIHVKIGPSNHWEVITIHWDNGLDLLRHLRYLSQRHGPVFDLTATSRTISCFAQVFTTFYEQQITEPSQASDLCYRLFMALYQDIGAFPQCSLHPAVWAATRFIDLGLSSK